MRRWQPYSPIAGAPIALAQLSPATVINSIEVTLAQDTTPETLYERWESQRWAAGQIDFAPDRRAWHGRASNGFRTLMELIVKSLIIGEYTAVDHVSVIIAGAPEESYLAYLATQSADEAQHWRFITRIASEIMGGETRVRPQLADAWLETTPGMRELVLHEAELARELTHDVHDYELWLQLVTIFHLMTEGVLATNSQRAIIRLLAQRGLFPGLQAGFSALARDEGRHVAFGLHALREGIAQGYGDAIWDTVEHVVPAAVTVDVAPGSGKPERALARRSGCRLIETLERRLRSLEADQSFISHVSNLGMAALTTALASPEDAGQQQ
jgi:ribonucleotide reductase beta subunit family protein with ferritin-like domain